MERSTGDGSTGRRASAIPETSFNGQFGLAVQIAALRRSAPRRSPAPRVLIAAELPVVVVEVALAAVASFTLVGPLGVPWWVPLLCFAFALTVISALTRVAGNRHAGFWKGLAVMRGLQGRSSIIGLIVCHPSSAPRLVRRGDQPRTRALSLPRPRRRRGGDEGPCPWWAGAHGRAAD